MVARVYVSLWVYWSDGYISISFFFSFTRFLFFFPKLFRLLLPLHLISFSQCQTIISGASSLPFSSTHLSPRVRLLSVEPLHCPSLAHLFLLMSDSYQRSLFISLLLLTSFSQCQEPLHRPSLAHLFLPM